MEAKQLSKQMAAKGLKKLKFYCQMCKKQCSDANGFKCHVNSDQHKRQMRVFAQDSGQFLDEFSRTFEETFVELLKQKFFGRSFPINKIYMEYIKDKHHIHMNATKWSTLSEFAYYLERKGLVQCEAVDKGVMVTLIDRTLQTIERQKQEEKKQQQEEKLKKLQDGLIQKQIKSAKEQEEQYIQEQIKQNEQKKQAYTGEIKIAMNTQKKTNFDEDEEDDFMAPKTNNNKNINNNSNGNKNNALSFQNLQKEQNQQQNNLKTTFSQNQQKNSSVNDKEENENDQNEITQLELLKKQIKKDNTEEKKSNDKEIKDETDNYADDIGVDLENTPWVQEGIIVKIKDKKLDNGKYYKKKAIITKVEDEFLAHISPIDNKSITIKMDQNFLETVIPKIENKVMVLKPGPYCKQIGVLESLQKDNFSGSILMEDKKLISMPYELFSKIQENE